MQDNTEISSSSDFQISQGSECGATFFKIYTHRIFSGICQWNSVYISWSYD